ncbi:MAG: TonB-dependent receptor [Steroidobacteraceae bacterium]
MSQSKKMTATALALGISVAVSLPAGAADQTEAVETVVITGSLIPQAQVETAVPVTTISAEEIQARGYTSVADALQSSTFSTGSVQGAQFSGGFTPGAQTLSMFGLSPSYVKYLIDGRPMSDYPALYNGTDAITSITGIPIGLVDHIDVLPGGQSSIYGSDAIAGVVNVILKKKLDAPVVDLRLGGYKYGGGTDRMASLADSFTFGKLTLLAGAQFEKVDPIWGYQRPLTDKYNTNGTSPQTAERDIAIFGYYGDTDGNTYYFEDPNNCTDVSGEFGNTLSKRYRSGGRGYYCGTTNAGYYTIGNGDESMQGYLHGTFDLTDNVQLYGDLLLNHDKLTYNAAGALWYGTSVNYGYYVDENLEDFTQMQLIFDPGINGGVTNNMNTNTTNAWRSTLGAQGNLFGSSWTYDVAMTHTEQKLTELTHVLWNDEVESWMSSNILGDVLGDYYGYSILSPDYTALYEPISDADYRSFSGYASSASKTFDNMLRAQFTQRELFKLPGGDAGLAVVAEVGNQGWKYDPDERFLTGETWGYTSTAGAGHRSRYALTSELRLPVFSLLTATAAGRYDAYKVSGQTVDKTTYTLGLEFRPVETLLARARYGTAFKVPTLADEYQGLSGYYTVTTDYWWCEENGYTGSDISDCDYYQQYQKGTTSGSTKLKPITAKVWDLGLVWSPGNLVASADFLHWDISNEVTSQSIDQILKTEMYCRDGTYDASSPTCVAALAQVTRDADTGLIDSVSTPKVNVSKEIVSAVAVSLGYTYDVGSFGTLDLKTSWNDMVKHTWQQYAGDDFINLLTNPYWSTDFKSKVDASLTWTKGDWRTTLYAIRYGKTPNYLANYYEEGYATEGAGKLPAWTLANLSASYKVTPNLELTGTIDNLFNRMPPADDSYPGTSLAPLNIFNYNNYGQSYYVELNYKFK